MLVSLKISKWLPWFQTQEDGPSENIMYLVLCKNFCKCPNGPLPNTTIKREKKRKFRGMKEGILLPLLLFKKQGNLGENVSQKPITFARIISHGHSNDKVNKTIMSGWP
jgi:hypothetical protein